MKRRPNDEGCRSAGPRETFSPRAAQLLVLLALVLAGLGTAVAPRGPAATGDLAASGPRVEDGRVGQRELGRQLRAVWKEDRRATRPGADPVALAALSPHVDARRDAATAAAAAPRVHHASLRRLYDPRGPPLGSA